MGELFLSAEYRGLKSWVFGGTLPVVLLTVEGDTRGGLGNSIVYGEACECLDGQVDRFRTSGRVAVGGEWR